ncbi:MAG TPA: hypothetical protein VME43_31440 [Bryobacteraceae bacterium]|nr:hypothetical protein [Bryobacteraceae bacterium]
MLAGLDVTAKAIERTAEAIGTNIAQAEQQEVNRAKQLVFPIVSKQTISKMYVLMDGTGVPVVPAEAQGRIGKIEGQRARTRECKLGCVFTQTTVDEGRAIRDPDSTTYRGAIETAQEFGLHIYTEAWRRGWEWASLRIVIGDGAVWIWNLADTHFPGAVQIVDLYHARQHLWAVAALWFPNDSARQKRWMVSLNTCSIRAGLSISSSVSGTSYLKTKRSSRSSPRKPNTSKGMRRGCATQSFASLVYSWFRGGRRSLAIGSQSGRGQVRMPEETKRLLAMTQRGSFESPSGL